MGFAFDLYNDSLVLIQKLRPEWQKGKYNGVGGKIEPNETPKQAMVREFREETGLSTTEQDWREFAVLEDDNQSPLDTAGSKVWVFVTDIIVDEVESRTDEQVSVFGASQTHRNTIPNLAWLIPAAKLFLSQKNFHLTARYFNSDSGSADAISRASVLGTRCYGKMNKAEIESANIIAMNTIGRHFSPEIGGDLMKLINANTEVAS